MNHKTLRNLVISSHCSKLQIQIIHFAKALYSFVCTAHQVVHECSLGSLPSRVGSVDYNRYNKTWNFLFSFFWLQRLHKTIDNSTLSVWPCDVWSSTQPRFFSLLKRYAWVPVDGSNQDVAGTRERSWEELIKAASLSPPPSCWLAMTQAQTDEYLIPSGVALDTTSANPKSSSTTIWNVWKYLLASGAHHIISFFVKGGHSEGKQGGYENFLFVYWCRLHHIQALQREIALF